MDDLLKDAIADAKAVRETALANAKLALEEAFTPRIQSMLSQKIQSEIEDEDEVADADEMSHEEGEDHDEEEKEAPEVAVEPEEGEEVEDIADVADEVEDEDEMAHEGEEEDHDEMAHEEGVIEIDGVKYAPVVSEEEDEDEAMHEEEDEDEGYNEDLDLEAVLRELEEGEEEDEDEVKDESVNEEEEEDKDEKMDENDVSSEIGAADNKLKPEAGDSTKIGQGPEGQGSDKPAGKELEDQEIVDDLKEDIEVSEDIDLEEVLKALTEEEDEDEMKKEEEEKDEKMDEQINTLRADLEEHRNVVKYLRGKLNEVNLLNAKLLFTNKLFRNFGLSNEQKLKVVETFDRATNLREVKLVFSTLAESFGNKVASKPSKPIKESKGSASKAVASTKPKSEEVISEGFEMKERFQKLAKIL